MADRGSSCICETFARTTRKHGPVSLSSERSIRPCCVEVKSRRTTAEWRGPARLKRIDRMSRADLGLLEMAGLLKLSYQSNPRHGKLKLVSPVARQYTLTATV